MSDLFEKARAVRENAHAPYSKFRVGAALRTLSGKEFVGCNVENSAYPQGTCAEAGAIGAMIAASYPWRATRKPKIEPVPVVSIKRQIKAAVPAILVYLFIFFSSMNQI